MRQAHPDGDVAITNGGALRADLPAGPLTYGALFTANPFDNRFATFSLTGAELGQVIQRNLEQSGGILSLSGVPRRRPLTAGGELTVTLTREAGGGAVGATERLTVVTSDFLATGGNNIFPADAVAHARIEDGPPIREAMAALLEARGGTLDGRDPRLANPARPRLGFPPPRPVSCRGARAAPPRPSAPAKDNLRGRARARARFTLDGPIR